MNGNQKAAVGLAITAVAACVVAFIPGAGPVVAVIAPIVSALAGVFGIVVTINNQPGK